jgi:hypothetical protein
MQAGVGIDRQTLFNEIGYEPHTRAQMEIHTATERFLIPCCGRRWGKSRSAGHWMTEQMFVPDSWHWIVGPTYTLGEKEFRVVWDDLFMKMKLRHPKIRKGYNTRQGNMYIELPWNSHLEVKSADKPDDGLVGEGLHSAVMSEAAKHKMDTWTRYIEPALSDNRGAAIFPSTPEGFNWYHGLFELGQDPQHGAYRSWHLPSWTNPIAFPGGFDDPEIQRIRQVSSPQWFSQEYGANFTTFEGQIYDEFDHNVHVKEFDYVPTWRNYWAIDFGFADPFVCLDIMVDPSDNVYVWREYYIRYMSTYEHGHALRTRQNPDGFHVNAMFADPAGADEIATLAMIIGPMYGRSREVSWKQGVEAVKRQLRIGADGMPKLFIHPRCRNLIREIQALRIKKAATDERNAREGQFDKDDHTCDALRYFHAEFFVLGAGGSIGNLYSGGGRTESDSFFKLAAGEHFANDSRIGF